MTTRKERESFWLGLIAAGTVAFALTLVASLLPLFHTDPESPSTPAGAEVAVAEIGGSTESTPSETPREAGRPQEGRGPGTGRGPANPLVFGTADPAVLEAFEAGGCVACHSVKGVGGGGATVGPPPFRTGAIAADRRPGPTPEAYIEQSILEPYAFIVPNCPNGPCPEGVMPQTYEQILSTDQLATIVGYLSALGTPSEAEVLTSP